jgi:uncharacterized membrane protein
MYHKKNTHNIFVRLTIALFITMITFNVFAFNGGGNDKSTLPKQDLANGG